MKPVTSEKGYYDKIVEGSKSDSDSDWSIASESLEDSDNIRGKTDLTSETTETDELPSLQDGRSEGKKTFEKNITNK